MVFKKIQILMPVLFVGIISCGQAKQDLMTKWDGRVIDQLGIYQIEGHKYLINVFKDDASILHYAVYNASGEKIIESTESASITQRWCLFWDKSERLWVWSSDIGGFLWEKGEDGHYIQTILTERKHFDAMPNEVFDFLPTGVKKKLKSEGVAGK